MARKKPAPAPRRTPDKSVLAIRTVAIEGTVQWWDWVDRVARLNGMDEPALIAATLRWMAGIRGWPEPPPRVGGKG